jgi:hypothetical protein
MSQELKFANTNQALQYLADYTNQKVIVSATFDNPEENPEDLVSTFADMLDLDMKSAGRDSYTGNRAWYLTHKDGRKWYVFVASHDIERPARLYVKGMPWDDENGEMPKEGMEQEGTLWRTSNKFFKEKGFHMSWGDTVVI